MGGPTLRGPIAASVAGKTVEMATLILLATLVPRALGPSDYGRFAVALTIVTLGSLALTLGGPALVTRYVPGVPPDEQIPLARALGVRLAREAGFQTLRPWRDCRVGRRRVRCSTSRGRRRSPSARG